jgi:hypothetical protein
MQPGRVYNLRQAKQDIDSIYSTGLFEDVNIVPQEAEDSTESHPKVLPLLLLQVLLVLANRLCPQGVDACNVGLFRKREGY